MLVPIQIKSIYNNNAPLPLRMAKCAPDMASAIESLKKIMQDHNLELILSDLYRSYDMQYQAYLDYISGKKRAFSPPPGGSMHEAGRAMDIDLACLKHLTLNEFWTIIKPLGFLPIIDKPYMNIAEAWHFDFRGSFQKIYDYALSHNMPHPYQIMAQLAIMENDTPTNVIFYIQGGLVRLDKEIGSIDGILGRKCKTALTELGYTDTFDATEPITNFIQNKIKVAYPQENPDVHG